MKRVFLVLVLMAVLPVLVGFKPHKEGKREGVEWKEWNQAYPKAIESKKILLIDIYTDWCGWCKRMDKDTYAKENIQDLIEGDFIPVKFNPEEENKTYVVDGNEVNGRQLLGMLVQGNRVGYPTTVFLIPKADEFKPVQVSGYQGPSDFKKTLNKVMGMK